MEWRRFRVPAFDHRALKGRPYVQPTPISGEEEARIVAAASGGDPSVAGAYAVAPNKALLARLDVRGDHQVMMLCALPGPGAHLLGAPMPGSISGPTFSTATGRMPRRCSLGALRGP